jgi:hypothetical protein
MNNSIDNTLKDLEKKVEQYQSKVNENLSMEEISQLSKELEDILGQMAEIIQNIDSDE